MKHQSSKGLSTGSRRASAVERQRVLLRSKRRCALCFSEGNSGPQSGVIAHLIANQAADADNLAFLCVKHHAQLDSGDTFTIDEVKSARDKLYRAMSIDEQESPTLSDMRDFEARVADLIKGEFSSRFGDSFALFRNTLYSGNSGVSHEVDIAVEFVAAGMTYLTIFEVKGRRGPLGVQEVLEFASRARDLRADKAVLITGGGITASASRVATNERIEVIELGVDQASLSSPST